MAFDPLANVNFSFNSVVPTSVVSSGPASAFGPSHTPWSSQITTIPGTWLVPSANPGIDTTMVGFRYDITGLPTCVESLVFGARVSVTGINDTDPLDGFDWFLWITDAANTEVITTSSNGLNTIPIAPGRVLGATDYSLSGAVTMDVLTYPLSSPPSQLIIGLGFQTEWIGSDLSARDSWTINSFEMFLASAVASACPCPTITPDCPCGNYYGCNCPEVRLCLGGFTTATTNLSAAKSTLRFDQYLISTCASGTPLSGIISFAPAY